MYLIDYLFLGFAFISLYLIVFFMILFVENWGRMSAGASPEVFPSLSLIVPAYNEEIHIGETIKAVKNLSYPVGVEVIVVDDGSTDKTAERAEELGVRVIRQDNAGKAAALNRGISEAMGEVVGCVDADSYPAEDALLKMITFFSDTKVAAVTSSILVRDARNFLQKLQEMEYLLIAWNRKLLDYLNSVYVTPGPLSLYRKSVLEKLGGFDENVLTEDIEIAWRLQKAHYRIRMALPAKVYTTAPSSFRSWWRQRLRWDIGGIQTASAYKNAFLSKRYGVFGLFIVPYFSVSIILSLVGLALFLYLLILRFSSFMEFWYYAKIAGVNPMNYFSLNLLPNVFTVFGLTIFFTSLIYLFVGLKAMDKPIRSLSNFFEMLIYLSIYLFLFPILLIHSFWRLLVYRKQKW
ncbi:MAG: glycosyltransferase family 2 protein [Candidatus Altiarchaeota archaeon]|nr:glycosyltransferase family 2 protein [Candidatus Altiarchaeota archaeon]